MGDRDQQFLPHEFQASASPGMEGLEDRIKSTHSRSILLLQI